MSSISAGALVFADLPRPWRRCRGGLGRARALACGLLGAPLGSRASPCQPGRPPNSFAGPASPIFLGCPGGSSMTCAASPPTWTPRRECWRRSLRLDRSVGSCLNPGPQAPKRRRIHPEFSAGMALEPTGPAKAGSGGPGARRRRILALPPPLDHQDDALGLKISVKARRDRQAGPGHWIAAKSGAVLLTRCSRWEFQGQRRLRGQAGGVR